MIDTPDCPICNLRSWIVLGKRTYRLSDAENQTSYVQKRYRVLFEVWFPGESAKEITSCLCSYCGFILYTPRPEVEDLDAKYRFLARLGGDPGLSPPPHAPLEIERAKNLYCAVSSLAGRKLQGGRVLDFGGGDGRLMYEFLAAGCDCDLVDYSTTSLPGVRKVGDTIDAVTPSDRYDCIICSHVIEHVANPLQILRDLRSRLASAGVLYVEVPMEIWGKPPLQSEPVTHINFFTQTSLQYLMLQAGLSKCVTRLSTYLHPDGRNFLAVRALGEMSDTEIQSPRPNCRETVRFLRPGLLEKIYRRNLYYQLSLRNLLR